MKELKYPENKVIDDFGIEIRPYLYQSEKKQIVEKLLEISDPLDRELCLYSILFDICCGIPEGTDYDLLCALGLKRIVYDELFNDIIEIETALTELEDSKRLVAAFLADMTDLMNKMTKKIPTGAKLDKLVDKFAKVIGTQAGE